MHNNSEIIQLKPLYRTLSMLKHPLLIMHLSLYHVKGNWFVFFALFKGTDDNHVFSWNKKLFSYNKLFIEKSTHI